MSSDYEVSELPDDTHSQTLSRAGSARSRAESKAFSRAGSSSSVSVRSPGIEPRYDYSVFSDARFDPDDFVVNLLEKEGCENLRRAIASQRVDFDAEKMLSVLTTSMEELESLQADADIHLNEAVEIAERKGEKHKRTVHRLRQDADQILQGVQHLTDRMGNVGGKAMSIGKRLDKVERYPPNPALPQFEKFANSVALLQTAAAGRRGIARNHALRYAVLGGRGRGRGSVGGTGARHNSSRPAEESADAQEGRGGGARRRRGALSLCTRAFLIAAESFSRRARSKGSSARSRESTGLASASNKWRSKV
eukprot:1408967-Rhodomonas_salina.1